MFAHGLGNHEHPSSYFDNKWQKLTAEPVFLKQFQPNRGNSNTCWGPPGWWIRRQGICAPLCKKKSPSCALKALHFYQLGVLCRKSLGDDANSLPASLGMYVFYFPPEHQACLLWPGAQLNLWSLLSRTVSTWGNPESGLFIELSCVWVSNTET